MNEQSGHFESTIPPSPWVSRVTTVSAKQLLIAAGILAAAGTALWMVFLRPASVSTDNAYIDAPVISLTSQVSGPALSVAVRDNQHVHKGDLLVQVDPRPFQIALEQAEANLELARQGVGQGSANTRAAAADVAQRRADLAQARSDAARAHGLAPKGYLSREDIERADTRVNSLAAELQSAEAKLEKARAELGQEGDANVAVKAAQAAVDAARLKLSYTELRAPFDGTVSNLSLQDGSMIQTGVPLFALIGDQEVWVDANFKETQFRRLHPGLKAEVRIDMYPGHVFHGTVDSISGGSGTAFSLLPPQNATGNWVKVTQRVPVKIIITDADPRFPLRIGTSADVKVLTD